MSFLLLIFGIYTLDVDNAGIPAVVFPVVDSASRWISKLLQSKGGNYNNYAEQTLDTANVRHEHIYIKSDCYLDDGFEIVSHPMTLEYHINEMDSESILQAEV